jgi:hypothetical protein
MAPAFAALRMHAQATMDPPPAAHQAQPPDCHELADVEPAPLRQAPAQAPDDCLQYCLDLCLQQGPALGRQALALPFAGSGQTPRTSAQPQPPSALPFPPLRPPIA